MGMVCTHNGVISRMQCTRKARLKYEQIAEEPVDIAIEPAELGLAWLGCDGYEQDE